MTNAIIHADLMINGVLKVEKFDDRFVFTNPGLLKLPVEQIYAGGESRARNLHIQSLFRMIGYGENIGSGFPLILNAWDEKHWLRPELIEQPELLQVKLILNIEDKDSHTEITPQKSSGKSSGKIVDMISKNPNITIPEMAEVLQTSERNVQKHIKNLREQGIIRRIGPDKGGHWEIVAQG